jgi:hypothetical protein
MTPAEGFVLHGYGAFRPRSGAALYLSGHDLALVGGALREGDDASFQLDSPPIDLVEEGPIRALRLQPLGEGRVVISADEEGTLRFAGGPEGREKLGLTLINLGEHPDAPHGTAHRHVDLAYFPDHPFLDAASMWITVSLVANGEEHAEGGGRGR